MDHLHISVPSSALINTAAPTCVDCDASGTRLKRERCSSCYPKHWRALKLSGAYVDLRVRPLKERLLEKTAAGPGACVIYTGGLNPRTGYGNIRHGGKSLLAHRVAYELLVGPIPQGLQLDHLCRVRRCINPHHLEPVTARENTRRAVAAKAGGTR